MFCLVPNQPIEVVLPMHRSLPTDQQPVWTIRSLPSRTIAELSRLIESDQGRALVVVVQAGLVGWRNVCNPDGSPAPFRAANRPRTVYGIELPRGGAEGDLVDQIPFEVMSQLVAEILATNSLGRADAKN